MDTVEIIPYEMRLAFFWLLPARETQKYAHARTRTSLARVFFLYTRVTRNAEFQFTPLMNKNYIAYEDAN